MDATWINQYQGTSRYIYILYIYVHIRVYVFGGEQDLTTGHPVNKKRDLRLFSMVPNSSRHQAISSHINPYQPSSRHLFLPWPEL